MLVVHSQHFETETDDLAGVEWSPDGRVLGVWESCLKVCCNVVLQTASYLNALLPSFNFAVVVPYVVAVRFLDCVQLIGKYMLSFKIV